MSFFVEVEVKPYSQLSLYFVERVVGTHPKISGSAGLLSKLQSSSSQRDLNADPITEIFATSMRQGASVSSLTKMFDVKASYKDFMNYAETELALPNNAMRRVRLYGPEFDALVNP